MKNTYFLLDDNTGHMLITRVTGRDIEAQIERVAELENMPSPYSSNLTWGGVSAISINV